MVEDAAVFSVMSKCFAPVEREEWKHLTESSTWSDFLDGARRLIQEGGGFGVESSPASRWHQQRCPLQDFLSEGEVDALFCPPTYDEKHRFFARHFTGGLPESALPIESLYTEWNNPAEARGETLFPQAKGLYLGQSARYMDALVESLGLTLPAEYADCPDHLALELDAMAIMLRSGMTREARTFLAERFEWLTAYRMKLLGLDDDARFYIGLVDVLLAVCADQAELAHQDATNTRDANKRGLKQCQKTL